MSSITDRSFGMMSKIDVEDSYDDDMDLQRREKHPSVSHGHRDVENVTFEDQVSEGSVYTSGDAVSAVVGDGTNGNATGSTMKSIDDTTRSSTEDRKKKYWIHIWLGILLIAIVVGCIVAIAKATKGSSSFRDESSLENFNDAISGGGQEGEGNDDLLDGDGVVVDTAVPTNGAASTPTVATPATPSPTDSPTRNQGSPTAVDGGVPSNVANGEICTEGHEECASNACGYVFADSGIGLLTAKRCCDSGEYVVGPGALEGTDYPYCSKLQLGASCGTMDALCAQLQSGVQAVCHNGQCKDPNNIQTDGDDDDEATPAEPGQSQTVGEDVVTTPLPAGEPCQENENCETKACGYFSYPGLLGVLNPKLCCPSGKVALDYVESFLNDPNVPDDTLVEVPYCTELPLGTVCGPMDQMCQSNATCIGGFCKDTVNTIENGDPCVDHVECKHGACGFKEFGIEDVVGGKTCCESGSYHTEQGVLFTYDYCTGLPEDAACGGLDMLCGNGLVCVGGILGQCRNESSMELGIVDGEGAQDTPNGERCDEHNDCESLACGFSSFPPGVLGTINPRVCCESGEFHSEYYERFNAEVPYCTKLEVGTSCGGINEICESGHCIGPGGGTCRDTANSIALGEACEDSIECSGATSCGYKEYNVWDGKVCCEGPLYTEAGVLGIQHDYCTGLPVNSRCGSLDVLCAPGLSCISEQCQNETISELAAAEGDLADGEPCSESADCASGGCGFREFNVANALEGKFCCENGPVYTIDGAVFQRDYCTGLAEGARCGDIISGDINDLCASFQCSGGVCQGGSNNELPVAEGEGGQGLANGASCSESADCASGGCGFPEFGLVNAGGGKFCCENGPVYTINGAIFQRDYCTGLAEGARCGDLISGDINELCAEGLDCVNGVCQGQDEGTSALQVAETEGGQGLANGASCEESATCSSGSCGFPEFGISNVAGGKICCDAPIHTVNGALFQYDYCTGLADGSRCGTISELCESGSCVFGTCRAARTSRSIDIELPVSEISIQGASGNLLAGEACTIDSECVTNACAYASAPAFPAIQSKQCCETGNVHVDLSNSGSPFPYCQDLPNGSACGGINEICSSGACIGLACGDPNTIPNDAQCDFNIECISGACGYKELSLAAIGEGMFCCASGGVHVTEGFLPFAICTGLPARADCGTIDELCASMSCTGGQCEAVVAPGSEPILSPVGTPCTSDDECESGGCAIERYEVGAVFGGRTCCTTDETYSDFLGTLEFEYCKNLPLGAYCGGRNDLCESGRCVFNECRDPTDLIPIGDPCEENEDCELGLCGYGFYIGPANFFWPKQCCDSSSVFSEMGVALGGQYEFDYCTNLPSETLCGDDTMCASGLCIDSTCQDENLLQDALDGILQVNEPCVSGNECQNGACGFLSYPFGGFTSQVCCPSDSTFIEDRNGIIYHYCDDRPSGTACGWYDDICADGLSCIGTLCIESDEPGPGSVPPGSVANGQTCSEHVDCESNACGQLEWQGILSNYYDKVCCDSGQWVKEEATIFGVYIETFYCGGMPTGASCGFNDELCLSNNCFRGLCQEEVVEQVENSAGVIGIPDGQPCEFSTECLSLACGHTSYVPPGESLTRQKTCCVNAPTFQDTNPILAFRQFDYCTDLPDGTACGTLPGLDEICASGACINGSCSSRLGTGEGCDAASDCESNECHFASYPGGWPQQRYCCDGGWYDEDGFGWILKQRYTYCTNLPEGTVCGDGNDEMCASRLCENGRCTAP